MRLATLLTEHEIYHGGAAVPTKDLRIPTFFTDDKQAAQSYGLTVNATQPKLHTARNNITNAASEEQIIRAAVELGVYRKGTPPGDYITPAFCDKATDIVELLKGQGFDGIIIRDYAADQRTRIRSFIPFTVDPI